MAGLDEYIFGYERGKVEKKDTAKLVNTFLKLGICSEVKPTGAFTVRHRDKAKFTKHASGRIRFALGEAQGIYGFICRIKYRWGLLLGLILTALLYAFSSRLVWDVRISGNERLTDYAIEEALSEYGLKIGAPWRSIDTSLVEAELLSQNGNIAWISLNRRGTVAYVEVIESENIGKNEPPSLQYSNIIADRDGVIEQINVESGVAVVKVGDVVRKGDILISGVVENESSVRFCRAVGSVVASSVATVTAEAAEKAVEKTLSRRRIAEARVVIFNFSVNIFKNYGNRENSCDIIRETRKFALFDRYKLPFRLEKCYLAEYTDTERTLSKEEMTERAARTLERKTYAMFKDADIIGLRTTGEFSDGVYRLTSRVVYSADIGKESAIEIN